MLLSASRGTTIRRRPRRCGFPAGHTGLAIWLLLCGLCLALSAPLGAWAADGPPAGPLFDEFGLTLAPGHRIEALGPFFYSEQEETQRIWAVPPLLSYTRDPATESKEFDFLYPVLTYNRYGGQYRWQVFEVLSFAGGPTQRETARDRFTLFPLYFQQRSSDTNQNYTAVFPVYGHLKHRLFRDDIFFALFPLYSETRKKDVVTDNYLWPLFSPPRRGAARLEGLAAGRERAQGCHYPNQRVGRRYHQWRAQQLLYALAVVLQHAKRDRHHQRAVAAVLYPRLRLPAFAAARLDYDYLALLQLRGRPGEEIP